MTASKKRVMPGETKSAEYSMRDIQFLLRASELLGMSIDYMTTLKNVANLAVEGFADWCAVHIVETKDNPTQITVAHKDPQKVKMVLAFQKKYPPEQNQKQGVYHVIKTGKSELMEFIPPELLQAAAKNKEQAKFIEKLQLVSYICVPIKHGNRVLGAISFVSSNKNRLFTKLDLKLAENLADRAAQAIENALLYQEAQRENTKRRKFENELKKLNAQLEGHVIQRTEQLNTALLHLKDEVKERIEAEKEISKLFHTNKLIMDSMGEGIYGVDRDGTIILLNKAAERMLGLKFSEVKGKIMHLISHYKREDGSEYLASQCPVYASFKDGKKKHVTDEVFIRHDGTAFPVEYITNPILEGRKVVGAVVSFNDITKQREAEQQIRQTNYLLQQSNKELENFASVASHDLQEPLRKIQAFGDRLQKCCGNGLDPEARDYLYRMLYASQRMQALIEDLLTFSRVSTQAKPFQKVNVNEAIDDVLSDLEMRIQDTHAKIKVEKLPSIDSDPTQIKQLFLNLISNALKFHKVDVQPQITISGIKGPTNGHGRTIQFCIEDNGIGFDEKYLDKIFQMFQRLHGRDEYQGTGIGLAVCRKIVERHHGRITAHSKPGKGTKFIVTLPIKQIGGELHARQ